MLEILNPCNNPNAWWQQLLMLGLPLLLGYLWGKGNANAAVDSGASARLASLDTDLADCRRRTSTAEANLRSAETAATSATTATSTGATINSLADTGVAALTATVGAATAATGKAAATQKDDLKVVEGIGPKIESLFNDAGIYTFGQLAATSADRLKEILEVAGSRFQMHDPSTWPAQGKLAGEGKWEELKRWQDELNKGQA
jgi:predicted flap endonuclease-1-like 5' DNA nuclease